MLDLIDNAKLASISNAISLHTLVQAFPCQRASIGPRSLIFLFGALRRRESNWKRRICRMTNRPPIDIMENNC